MEFTEDELGIIMASLATLQKVTEKLDEAKEIGLVPPCLELPDGYDEQINKVLSRVRKSFMT